MNFSTRGERRSREKCVNLDFPDFLKELYIKISVCSDTYGFFTIEKSTLRCYALHIINTISCL